MSGISDSWPVDGISWILEEHCGMSYVIQVIIPNLVVVLDSQVKIFWKRHKIILLVVECEVANRQRQVKKSALQINGLFWLDIQVRDNGISCKISLTDFIEIEGPVTRPSPGIKSFVSCMRWWVISKSSTENWGIWNAMVIVKHNSTWQYSNGSAMGNPMQCSSFRCKFVCFPERDGD